MSTLDTPWYQDGLRFECTRCGACCAGTPGYVWVNSEEIERLASFLGESVEQFGRKYLRLVGDRVSLVEIPRDSCVFWDAAIGCKVYEARPDQCRTWPFWPENVKTPQAWKRTERVCPGAGTGQLISVESITASLARSPE